MAKTGNGAFRASMLLVATCGLGVACPSPSPPPGEKLGTETATEALSACRSNLRKSSARPATFLPQEAAKREDGEQLKANLTAAQARAAQGSASGWFEVGKLQLRIGDMDQAEVAFRRSEALQVKAGAYAEAASSAQRLSAIAYRRSEFASALETAQRALRYAELSENVVWRTSALTLVLALLGDVGDYPALQALAEKELRKSSSDSHAGQLALHSALGRVYQKQDRHHLAIRSYQKALEAALRIDDRPDFARGVRYNLASSYFLTKQPAKAEAQLRAVDAAQGSSSAVAYWCAWLNEVKGQLARSLSIVQAALKTEKLQAWVLELELLQGRLLEGLGKLEEAGAAYRRASLAAERLREDAQSLHVLAAMNDDYREPYEALVRLEIRRGNDLKALAITETVKGRVYAEAFSRVHPNPRLQEDPIRAARDRIERLQIVLPALAAPSTEKTAQLVQSVSQAHPILVFLRSGSEFIRFFASQGALESEILEIPAKNIDRMARGLVAEPENTGLAKALARAILPKSLLKGSGGPLYIIADDRLGDLPFALLQLENKLLVEHFELAYAPNLRTLAHWRRRGPGKPAGRVAVLSASVPSAGDALPAAIEEAKWVAKRFGVTVHPRAQAADLEAAAQANLVHVASHGAQDDAGARIYLADGPVGPDFIISKKIGPDLVVLASCESAARSGRELWGSVAAAFSAAGARNVVATLWSVEDSAAHAFVRAFYKAGGDKAPRRALAEVQRAALRRGEPAERWAAFVNLGR